MTLGARCVALLLALAAGVSQPSAQAAWTWVTGELSDEDEQARYEAFAQRMFDFYQGRGLMSGKLVAQSDLETFPSEYVVLLGPVEAFTEAAWFAPFLEPLPDGSVRLGEFELAAPRTGIFLRSADQKRFFYTGLSLSGFEDIFSVPTGNVPCTVTVDKAPRYRGSWNGEALHLEALRFAPTYPSPEELSRLGPLADGASIRDVLREDGSLAPAFAGRIDRLVEDQRVLFVGENHWNSGVNRLFNRVLAHLLPKHSVRAVFLELNFSFSAFLNYYVGLGDDGDAEAFLADELHALLDTDSELALLDTLRVWNREHPDRPIAVACLDMEWGIDNVLQRVVRPFFASLENGTEVRSPQALGGERWRTEELARLHGILEGLEPEDAPGAFPFLTREFMTQVLINLEDTLNLGSDRMLRRQQHIVRNIVEFHGELVGEGLTVFKGGGFHAQKETPPDRGTYRDAAYLHQVYEPTRGRVATMILRGVGYDFSSVHGVDLTTRQPSATNYMNFVRSYQEGVGQGTARPGEYYLLNRGGIGSLELLLARHGHHARSDVLWIEKEAAEALLKDAGLDANTDRASDFDLQVFVLRSTLEPTRPLVYGKD